MDFYWVMFFTNEHNQITLIFRNTTCQVSPNILTWQTQQGEASGWERTRQTAGRKKDAVFSTRHWHSASGKKNSAVAVIALLFRTWITFNSVFLPLRLSVLRSMQSKKPKVDKERAFTFCCVNWSLIAWKRCACACAGYTLSLRAGAAWIPPLHSLWPREAVSRNFGQGINTFTPCCILPRSSWPSGGRILVTVDIHSRTKSLPIASSKNYSWMKLDKFCKLLGKYFMQFREKDLSHAARAKRVRLEELTHIFPLRSTSFGYFRLANEWMSVACHPLHLGHGTDNSTTPRRSSERARAPNVDRSCDPHSTDDIRQRRWVRCRRRLHLHPFLAQLWRF